MNSFLEFIESDIESKKTLLSSLPTNTKTNRKKYNAKVDEILENYKYYEDCILKYLNAKSESFMVKDERKNNDELVKKLKKYKKIKFIMNPLNSFKEKLGFDNLLYDIHNYSSFKFNEINNIIQKLIDRFRMCGIILDEEDFKYTYYVYEYMKKFFEVNGNYKKLNDTFEKIYWLNPNIVEHIELNFRKLIKKHSKTFEEYISILQKSILRENGIRNYDDFSRKLKESYNELVSLDKETIHETIIKALNGDIDINNYLEDSKFRKTLYSSITINEIDFNNEADVNQLLKTLDKLKTNLVEYDNYLKYVPLFKHFKDKYEKNSSIDKTVQELKKTDSKILELEKKLDKINNKIFGKNLLEKINAPEPLLNIFKEKGDNLKNLKINSIKLTNELYKLYYKQEKLEFESKIISLKDESLLLISDVVKLYYSYNFFKKETFKEVFNIETYDEVNKMCEEFDEFASTPTNVVINGINAFEDTNVAEVISNKFRLENINIDVNDLDENLIVTLISKIDYLTRIYNIEHSKTTIQKIWFMVQVNKIMKKLESQK